MGSRDQSQEGAPYVWKTWRQAHQIVNDLAKGYVKLGLLPEVEGDGEMWKFMGVYSKNREEWILTDMATIRQSGTTVAFYDTLGPAAVQFVINQTGLTTISCSSNYLS